MSLTQQIGFSQRVRLEWLEETARLVAAGNDPATITTSLQAILKDKVSIGGTAERGNREKIITILLKVWLNVPSDLDPLRRDGLELLSRLSHQDRMAVQWGMIMAVYPFWAAVASQVGRLLRLQGSAAAAHVQRRIREQYGERETVSRAARRVLRSYLDWGVLNESGSKGIYTQGASVRIEDPRLISWLVEASLYVRPNRCAPLKDLIQNPGFFSFHLKQIPAGSLLASSSRLEHVRHGLDEELVLVRELSTNGGISTCLLPDGAVSRSTL